MSTLLLAAPLLVTLTLLVSGVAKLGERAGTRDAMTSLRLSLRSLHGLVASTLPAAEIALALLLWVPLQALQVVVAVLILLLFLAYLGIIARALTFAEQVECSCFGSLASPTVTPATLGRNMLLSILAVLTLVAALSGLLATATVHEPLAVVSLGGVVVAAVALTVLTLGGLGGEKTGTGADGRAAGASRAQHPSAAATPGAAGRSGPTGPVGTADDAGEEVPGEDGLLDYQRVAIPPAVLQRPDGTLVSLQRLTAARAALLIFVSEGCGPCERVMDHAPEWLEELSPIMHVHFVLSRPLDGMRERTRERVGEVTLHDPEFTARQALDARGAPSAVLLGADGMLAGGPVVGGTAVIEFVEEIRVQLEQARAEGEL